MLAARTVRIVLTYLAQLFYATHRDTNGTPQSVVGPEGLGTADKGCRCICPSIQQWLKF